LAYAREVRMDQIYSKGTINDMNFYVFALIFSFF